MVESRTLEILVKVKDLATSAISGIQAGISKFAVAAQRAFREVAIGFLRRIGELLLELPGKLLAAGAAFLKGADDIQKLAAALGTTAESFQKLSFAAQQSGLTQEKLADTGKFLVKAMETARLKSGEQRVAFQKLGVDVDELGEQQLDLVDIYARVADGLRGIQSPTERARVLMTLFGRSGHEVALLMEEGGAGIRALGQDLEDLGGVLNSSTIRMADSVGDQLNRLKVLFSGTFNAIAKEALPILERALTVFVEFLKDMRNTIGAALRGWGRTFIDVFDVIGQTVAVLAGIIRESFEDTFIILKQMEIGFLNVKGAFQLMERDMKGLAATTISLTKAQKELADLQAGKAKSGILTYLAQWEALKIALAAAGKEMAAVQVAADSLLEKSQTDEFFTGFGKGIEKFKEDLADVQGEGQRAAQALLQGSQSAVATFFTDIITGAASAKQAFKDMAVAILRLLAEMVAKFLAARIFGAIFGAPAAAGAGGAAGAQGFLPSAQRIGGFGGGSGSGFGPNGGGSNFGGGNLQVNVNLSFVSGEALEQVMSKPSMRKRLEDIYINSIRTRRDVRIAIAGV